MLGEVALRAARPDGWSVLATAGSHIKREAPLKLENLQERFGVPTLKTLLIATEGVFDVEEEATPGGGTRTIYRINPRWKLDIGSDAETDGSSPSGRRDRE